MKGRSASLEGEARRPPRRCNGLVAQPSNAVATHHAGDDTLAGHPPVHTSE